VGDCILNVYVCNDLKDNTHGLKASSPFDFKGSLRVLEDVSGSVKKKNIAREICFRLTELCEVM